MRSTILSALKILRLNLVKIAEQRSTAAQQGNDRTLELTTRLEATTSEPLSRLKEFVPMTISLPLTYFSTAC